MKTEIVLYTSSPQQVYSLSAFSSPASPVTVLYSGEEPFRLISGSQVTFYTVTPGDLLPVLDKHLRWVGRGFLLLLDSRTFGDLQRLPLLEDTAVTIPRLASLGLSSSPGLLEVPQNRFFGTLYTTRVLRSVSSWDPGDRPDLDLAGRYWAQRTRDQGWTHRTAYHPEFVEGV